MFEFGYIYILLNLITGEEYVGQTTKSLEDRLKGHKKAAKYGKKSHLYNSIRKHGPENFVGYILHKCHLDDLNEMEQHYIFELDTYRNGLNSTQGGEDNPMNNPENVAKMTESIKELYKDPQHLKIIKEARNKEETVEKLKKTLDDRHGEKRREIVDFYYKNKDELTIHEIAQRLGYKTGSTIISFKSKQWWKDLEQQKCLEEKTVRTQWKEKRELTFDIYYKYIGELTQDSIAEKAGVTSAQICVWKSENWWKDLKDQRGIDIDEKLAHKRAVDKSKHERRKYIFDTYHQLIGSKTEKEIGKILGFADGQIFTRYKKLHWWNQMEKDQGIERKNAYTESYYKSNDQRQKTIDKKRYQKRKHIFDFYCSNKDQFTCKEISIQLGYKGNQISAMKKRYWWKEFEQKMIEAN